MKLGVYTLVLAAGFLLMSAVSGLAVEDRGVKAPEGYILIPEDDWAYFMEDPAAYLREGREHYLTNELKRAAFELRRGAIYLRAEASRASDEVAQKLKKAAAGIESLADEIERGKVKSVSRIDGELSRAYYTLSTHYYEMAEKASIKKDLTKLANRLSASVYYLDRAIERSGNRADSAARSLMNRANGVAAKIRRGTGYSIEELGRTLSDLGREIERTGLKVSKP